MKVLYLALFLGIVATINACASMAEPGKTITTVTTSVTTVSIDDEMGSGVLSLQERSTIRRTWDQAKRNGKMAPKILFNFLKAHPDYQKKFSKFANVPLAELMDNGNFLAQSYTILAGLNVVIQSLSSQELLANQLNALGGAHQPRGITPAMFEQFGIVVEKVLQEEMGSLMSDNVNQAWKNGIRALVAGVSKTLKKPEDLADPLTKLTLHQIRDVQTSWEKIRTNRNAMVSSIFIKLFKETPRTLKHFPKFAAVPIDSLSGDAEFSKQVALVADRLDSIISSMDDKLQLLGNINYMKYSHIKRGISRDSFQDFSRLLLDVLGGRGVSSDDLDSWKSTLIVFVDGVSPRQ